MSEKFSNFVSSLCKDVSATKVVPMTSNEKGNNWMNIFSTFFNVRHISSHWSRITFHSQLIFTVTCQKGWVSLLQRLPISPRWKNHPLVMSKGTDAILVIVYSFLVVMSLKCDYMTVSSANINPFSFLTARSSSSSSSSSNSIIKQPSPSSSITSLIPFSVPSTSQVTSALSSVDWKLWLTKLSELALPAIKDAQIAAASNGGPPITTSITSFSDDKQLSALWNVINFARYILC